jgi:hypothetical protein
VQRDATKTVSAHFRAGAVRIDDSHGRIRFSISRRDEQHTIGADTKVAIADGARCGGIKRLHVGHVDHDEVVS